MQGDAESSHLAAAAAAAAVVAARNFSRPLTQCGPHYRADVGFFLYPALRALQPSFYRIGYTPGPRQCQPGQAPIRQPAELCTRCRRIIFGDISQVLEVSTTNDCSRNDPTRHFLPLILSFLRSINRFLSLTNELYIYRHWRSILNSELVTTTQVLLELISVRDGAFCMPEFDSMSVRQFIECICTNLYFIGLALLFFSVLPVRFYI